jgi:hypothetical protein
VQQAFQKFLRKIKLTNKSNAAITNKEGLKNKMRILTACLCIKDKPATGDSLKQNRKGRIKK